jgi:hypothetical protein
MVSCMKDTGIILGTTEVGGEKVERWVITE